MKTEKSEVSAIYFGEVASSSKSSPSLLEVELIQLNDKLFRLTFEYDGITYIARCFAEETAEGILFKVQEMITDDYILSGKSGFLSSNPKIHGGYMKRLNGLIFHIAVNHFEGNQLELFYFGKKKQKLPTYADSVFNFF